MLLPTYLLGAVVTVSSLLTKVSADPANVTTVQAFLDCLKYHNATDYAYYVTPQGYLTLSSLSGVNADADIDKTAFRVCNQLFGLGFYASFDLGFRRYYDAGLLNSIEDVSGEDLVNEGMIMRESPYSATDVATNTSVVNQYRTVAENIGYNQTEIESLINTNSSDYNINLVKRTTYYEAYATDSDTICANCDYGLFEQSTCYDHASSYQSARLGINGCGYVTGNFYPHHRCPGVDGKEVSAWYGVMSECVGDRPVYSWQADCTDNSCYKYIVDGLACPLVGLVSVAYYFGLLNGNDWGACVSNSCNM